MKKQEDLFTQTEKEFLSLSKWAREMIKNWEAENRPLNKQENDFMNELLSTEAMIWKDVNDRQKEAEDKAKSEEKEFLTVNEECPKCHRKDNAVVIGKMKSKNGYTVKKMLCHTCNATYADYMPIDPEEQQDWMQNFIEQLTMKREDGKSYAETLDLPPEFVQEKIDVINKSLKAGEKMKKAKQKADETKQTYQNEIQGLADQLLSMKINRTNWNKHIAEA